MQKIKSIKEYLNIELEEDSDLKENVFAFANLQSMPDDCPWKEHEGKTEAEFMQATFSVLGENNYFFQKIVSKVLEIGFIKLNSIALKKEYWVAIYLGGASEDEEPYVYCGGEPNINPLMPDTLTENSLWKNYPNFLQKFWSVHGFWLGDFEYGHWGLHLNEIINLDKTEGNNDFVPHATQMTQTIGEYIKDYYGYDHNNKDHFEEFYEQRPITGLYDDRRAREIQNKMPEALYYISKGNGDEMAVFFDENDEDSLRMIYMAHDFPSDIYKTFDHFLRDERTTL